MAAAVSLLLPVTLIQRIRPTAFQVEAKCDLKYLLAVRQVFVSLRECRARYARKFSFAICRTLQAVESTCIVSLFASAKMPQNSRRVVYNQGSPCSRYKIPCGNDAGNIDAGPSIFDLGMNPTGLRLMSGSSLALRFRQL